MRLRPPVAFRTRFDNASRRNKVDEARASAECGISTGGTAGQRAQQCREGRLATLSEPSCVAGDASMLKASYTRFAGEIRLASRGCGRNYW